MHAAEGVTLKQPHREEGEYREAVEMLDKQARRLSPIEVADAPESPFHGDEDLLRRMLLNLVDNAVRHTPPGGLVRLGLKHQPGQYRVTVSDTGPGIPAEARPHVFERFYRADKSRSRSEDGGAGLGLAIASWIAHAHGGKLELARSDDSGTVFAATLPAAPSR